MLYRMKQAFLVCLLVITQFAVVAQADYVPVGVQNDVALSTVLDGGWEIIYRCDYNNPDVLIDTVFAGAADNDLVMIAGIQDGSATIDTLAAATKADILTYTGHNVTHEANGALWYCNGNSLGFAGLGDVIYQNTADTNAQDERDRLSWHTNLSIGSRSNDEATYLSYGWRCGDNVWLNDTTAWDKLVLKYTGTPSVPAPGALLLSGIGLSVAGRLRRRFS